MTIYLDIVFIENLCMNYIIIFTTGYIMKVKIKHIRIILSSCLGSIYAILVYLENDIFFSNVLLKTLLSIVMVLITFNPKNMKQFFKQIIFFYLISFVFGGCAIFLLYFIKPQNVLIRNGVFVGKYPIKIAILGGIVGFIVTRISFRFIKAKLNKKDMYVILNIFFNDKEVKVRALIDTGNMLKDPISGMPVIIVCKNKLYDLLPKKILDNLENIKNGYFDKNEITNIYEIISRLRIIPFSSLGMQNGLLIGVKVDKIEIYFDEKKETLKNVIIGIYDKNLSKNDEYVALIGLNVLERSGKSEFTSNVEIKY